MSHLESAVGAVTYIFAFDMVFMRTFMLTIFTHFTLYAVNIVDVGLFATADFALMRRIVYGYKAMRTTAVTFGAEAVNVVMRKRLMTYRTFMFGFVHIIIGTV